MIVIIDERHDSRVFSAVCCGLVVPFVWITKGDGYRAGKHTHTMFHSGGRCTLGVVVLVPIIVYNEVGGPTTLISSVLAAIFSVFAGR